MEKVILLIKVPSTNDRKEDAMESFLLAVHKLLPKNSFLSLELASDFQFLKFYIVTHPLYRNIIESQLYAQYPEAEIEEVSDYLPTNFSQTALMQIDFKRASISPFRTYQHLEENFLKLLSAVLSKTESTEKAYFQLSLKRIGSKLFDRGLGGTYTKLFGKRSDSPASQKFDSDLFVGKLRLAYTAETKELAEKKLSLISNLLKSVKGSSNELQKRKFFVPNNLTRQFRERLFNTWDYYSASEIATLYHFPYSGSLVSNVVQTTSKRAPAPDVLPIQGNVDAQTVSFIAETNYRNGKKVFGLPRIDRRRHVYVVGKTGSGKSKLLELMLISDIQNNEGCCLLDPHGDLSAEVLKHVPKERIKDVVYIDPTDKNFPIGFNPLEPVADYEVRQHLSTFFIAIFKKLFAATWTPRMEHLIRYITLALLETPDSNILGIPRILSDTTYRQRVIQQIQDPVVKAFWTNEFTPSDNQFSQQAIIPLLNKIGQFIANPTVRNMVGQKKNVLDFEKFMNEGKIVIINLSKGQLGEENTALLGSMFITKIQQAALARAKMPESERRDFYFYVDEFQNFATDAFSSILSEARKYHLDLTIAHQYIAQLPDDVKATAFGNVGTMIVFSVGGDDAAALQKEFTPVLTADDMTNLNAREMYIKMSINGKMTPPFSATTLTVPTSRHDYTQEIMDNSRLSYAQNKTSVENEIAQWTQNSSVGLQESSFPEPII
jgi:energy-coupling factor transporter ATP-binding protein EcfA2